MEKWEAVVFDQNFGESKKISFCPFVLGNHPLFVSRIMKTRLHNQISNL
jgi:hypothetical protein